jgi:hypothetical protein
MTKVSPGVDRTTGEYDHSDPKGPHGSLLIALDERKDDRQHQQGNARKSDPRPRIPHLLDYLSLKFHQNVGHHGQDRRPRIAAQVAVARIAASVAA